MIQGVSSLKICSAINRSLPVCRIGGMPGSLTLTVIDGFRLAAIWVESISNTPSKFPESTGSVGERPRSALVATSGSVPLKFASGTCRLFSTALML